MGKIKKERVRRMKREGMHEIKNKWRSRAVNKRRRGLVLTPKKKRTAIKICASIASLVILVLGVFSIASMFTKYVAPNVVSDDFVTVNYDCPTDGSLPTDHSALENIGYLNNRFKKQTNWYLEMHGTTSTPVGPQSVNTFKQYSNGTMIMADVTSSGLVKAARQFCYVGNEVMWRLGSSYTGESFEAMQTIRWNTGEPYAHMTIENFKKKNGLPGTEMTVYIINEQTLLSADDVKDNGDGTYSQTYYLDPARDKAPAHYVNQMKFTGGLTDLPKFDYITVTFTFDEQWQLLAADVKEAYEATMGITVKCSSNFSTQYEYDTPKAESDAYETYFKNYVGKDIDDNAPEAVDAMNCLTSAFLTEPVTFGMTLDINGKGTKGVISLDASKLDIGAIMKEGGVDIAAALGNIGLKAQFGSVSVYLEDSTAYLSVGDLKAKLSIADLLEMITKKDAVATAAEITEADEGEEPAIFVIDNPETDEPNDGFTYTANESAKLLARLDLTSLGVGLVIPMSFEFKLDENNNAALTNASVNFAYGEIAAKIGLTESTETIADLTEEEKDAHIDLLPYAGALYESFKDGNLAVGLNYEGDTLGLRGAFDLSVNGGFALDGSITVIYNGQEKTVSVAYLDGKAYLEVDGIKVSADTKSAIALVKQIIEGMQKEPETQEAEREQEESVSLVETVLTAVFEKDIAALISMTEADDALEIAVKGTELLELFGVKFGLGDVGLTVSQKGEIEASAFGATVTLGKGEAVAPDTEGYAEIMPYVNALLPLIREGKLALGVSYATEAFALDGAFDLSVTNGIALAGTLRATYNGKTKSVQIGFTENKIYLSVEGIKVYADAKEAIALVKDYLGGDTDGEEQDMLEGVLNALFQNDLGTLLTVTEKDNALHLSLKGTQFIKAFFGADFALGDVGVDIAKDGKITANALGATITVEAGKEFAVDTAGYVDLLPYVNALLPMLQSENAEVGVHYAKDALAIDGTVKIKSFDENMQLAGEITVKSGESQQTVTVGYTGGRVYLALGSVKLSVGVDEALALVKQFVGSNSEEGADMLDSVLNALFDTDLSTLLTVSEKEGNLEIAITGSKLMKMFGVDFDLGNVNLSLSKNGTVTANALGATITVEAGKEFTVDTAGYTEIGAYAKTVASLLTAGTLSADIDFAYGGVTLKGAVTLSLEPVAVSGELTLSYKSFNLKLNLVYADGGIYLVADEWKAFASEQDIAALVSQFVPANEGGAELSSVLGTVLSLDFEKLLKVSENKTEAGNTLGIVIKGTELLSALNMNFDLGDIVLTVGADEITASVFGANVTLTAGGAVKALTAEEKAEYVNLKGVLARLPELLEKKALSLGGSVDVTVDKTKVKLTVNDGVFSFANGIYLYLDATLRLSETELNFVLSADSACIKVAFGNIGAEIRYDEIGSLGEAVVALYGDVRATLNPISETELLPEAKTVQELFKVLSALLGGKKEGAQSEGGFSLDSVLAGLTLKNSEKENGLLAIGVMGITVDVIDETQSGFLGISLGYEKDNISVGGKLSAAVYGGEIKKIEKDGMLGTHDFIELLDYVAAAMRSLAENNLNITLSGTIGSDDAEKYPEGVQYLLSGIVKLYSGEATAIHLNLDKKSLWVDADTYLYAKIDLEAATENDKSVYLELFVLDCDENGAKDGVLDAYVSVSFFKEGDTRRNPLTVYAPATELMPVLSSALALLGVDQQVISDYVISPWISDTQTVAQLKGFGKRIMQLAGNMLGGADGDAAAQSEQAAMNYEKLIESIKVGATQFEIALSQAELFGKEGAPLTVTIGKEQGANGTRLTAVSLANIGNTSVSVAIGYEEGERTAPTFKGTLKLDGIASLLQTLARSTTHEEKNGEVISGEEQQHSYVLNENFYVDGSIQLDINAAGILKEKLNIKVVAFSITVDENGVWGVNVRFEYDAMKVIGITAINGNTQVDLTGKDNMVYIKRVQTTDADGKPFAKPVTVYRAMPLSNFVGDMIGQMGFLFNLGSKITDLLGGIDMSGSGSGSAEAVDIGTTVSNILKSIDYQRLANGESWTITLNGAGLTNGTLGDIVIALGSDAQGKLRTLTAHTSLSTTGISMAIDANLTYHNPCGVMDAGVKDITTDIAALLTDGMSYKLSVVDWTNTKYIEGEYTSVEYVLMGEVIKKQDIVISTGAAGDAKGTVYGTLSYPDLTPYQTEKGYRAEWTTVYGKDDPLPESRQIFAQYKACTYRVTFALDGETVALDYLYGSADFELPFREDAARRIAYFVDEEGNEYRTAEDMKQVASDCTLTAVYEEIEYTIVFDLGDEKIEQKAHFGDTINYPEQPERTGYAFAGWDTMPETVSGDTTLTALWTANRYEITFVSKYEIEGYEWTADENGSYVTTFEFAYGSTVALPQGVRAQVGDKIYTLRGFCTAGDAVCYFEKLPNVTEDTLFTAQWEELGFDIVFVGRDGAETVLNYHAGEVIPASAIPTIPARDGYESAWKSADGSVIGGDYKVTGEARFAVVDTAKTYAVTVVGSQPYEGFTPADGNYVKTYSYVYDGAAVTLEPLNDIHAYWFQGYYTQADGAGERVEKVEGILEDTTVYVWWQDNAVTVNVYSDIRFEGSTRDNAKNGFYKQYTFRDNYGLDDSMLPKLDGYQTLALWHRTESGFERVTDVRNLNGEDLWVLWIKNIKVSVNDLYMTDYIGGKHYNIAGTVEGGTVFGNVSLEIFKQMNGSEKTTAIVDVTGANASDKYGNLDWGGTLDVQYGEDGVGSFSLLEQNCSNYAGGMWGNTATYGGAIIIKTFTLGNETVTTYSGSFKSIAKYSVVYRDANGKEIGRDDNARAACPFPYVKDGVSYECSDRTFADELAKKNGIAVPQKAGYTGVWAHDEIRGAMDVYPVYTANQLTSVRFESDRAVEGFRQEGDVYVYECEMQIGSLVSFFYDNKLMADAYTIVEGRNVITLPALTDVQKWGTSEIKADSANLYAQRNVDMIIYSSNSVAYTYDGAVDGATYLSFSQEVTAGYTMLTPKANGYRFLGWYREVNGAWEIVTSVSPTEGEEKVTTTVYALWLEDLTITEYSTTRKDKGWGTFEYVATVRVSGGRLYGTPYEAGAVTLQENMSFYYYVDGTNSKKDLGTNSYAAHKDMDSITNTTWQKRSRSHVRVTSTYEIKGYDAITVTLEQACDMTDI